MCSFKKIKSTFRHVTSRVQQNVRHGQNAPIVHQDTTGSDPKKVFKLFEEGHVFKPTNVRLQYKMICKF